MAKAYQERLIALIKDTVTLLCKNGLEYNQEFCVEGLLGVTLDKDEVFLIPIRELVNDKGVGTTDTTTDDVPLDVSQTDDMSSAMSPKRERKKKRRHAESTLTQDESDAGYGDTTDWDSKNERGTTENQDHDTNDNTNGGGAGDQPTAAKRRSRDDIKTDLSKVKAEDIVVIKEEVDDDEFVTAFQDSSMDSGSLNRTTEQTDSAMAYYSQPGPSQGGTGMPFSMDQLTEGSALSANMASLPPGSEGDTSWLQQSQASIQNPSGDWQGQKHQYFCDDCGKGYAYSHHLARHKVAVHLKYRFPCDLCQKTYSQQEGVIRHKRLAHKEAHQSEQAQHGTWQSPKKSDASLEKENQTEHDKDDVRLK